MKNRIIRENRISIDRDNFNQFKALKTYFNMLHVLGNVISYETRQGYHFLSEKYKRTTKQNMDMRRLFDDCDGRLELDEGRLFTGETEDSIEILFYEKTTDGQVRLEIGCNILAMSFWGNGEKWSRRT